MMRIPGRRGHVVRGLFLVAALLSLGLVSGCPLLSLTGLWPGRNGADDTVPGDPVPASQVKTWASDLYAALDRGDDLEELVGGILANFAPVLVVDEDSELIDEYLATGTPLFLDFHPAVLSTGFKNGIMVCAESFFASLNEAGIDRSSKLGFLTPELVWSYIRHNVVHELSRLGWVEKQQYTPGEVLPALVHALAIERVGATAGNELWGDGFLDPLQMTLLTYSFHYAAIGDVSASSRSTYSSHLKSRITGFVGDLIGLPLTIDQAVMSSITSSVSIYSHVISVTAQPSLVSKRETEKQNPPPYQSVATLEVSFSFVPHSESHRQFVTIMAPFPDNGPVPGKKVVWALQRPLMWRSSDDVNLAHYGHLSGSASTTGTDGKAQVTYTAMDEIPEDQRVTWRTVSGRIYGTVRGLTGSLIPTLEYVVVALNPDAGKDFARLTVHYWEPGDDPSPGQSWLPSIKPPALDL